MSKQCLDWLQICVKKYKNANTNNVWKWSTHQPFATSREAFSFGQKLSPGNRLIVDQKNVEDILSYPNPWISFVLLFFFIYFFVSWCFFEISKTLAVVEILQTFDNNHNYNGNNNNNKTLFLFFLIFFCFNFFSLN